MSNNINNVSDDDIIIDNNDDILLDDDDDIIIDNNDDILSDDDIIIDDNDDILSDDDDDIIIDDDDDIILDDGDDINLDDDELEININDINLDEDNIDITDNIDLSNLDLDYDDLSNLDLDYDDLSNIDLDYDLLSDNTISDEDKKNAESKAIYDSLKYIQWTVLCQENEWATVVNSDIVKHVTALNNGFTGIDKNKVKIYEESRVNLLNINPNATELSYIKYMIDNNIKAIYSELSTLNTKCKNNTASNDERKKIQTYVKMLGAMLKISDDSINSVDGILQKVNSLETTIPIRRYVRKIVDTSRSVWEIGQSNKSIKTSADRLTSAYREDLVKQHELLNMLLPVNNQSTEDINESSNEEDYSNSFTLVNSFKLTDTGIICSCSCGCSTTNKGNPISLTDIVKFNFINRSNAKDNYNFKQPGSSPEISKLVEELSDPSKVFTISDQDLDHANTNRLLHTINTQSTSNVYGIDFINRYYGCSCSFNFRDIICSHEKKVILPSRLMRYLSAWHNSHSDNIIRNYNDNIIAPGVFEYRYSVLADVIENYINQSTDYDEQRKKYILTEYEDMDTTVMDYSANLQSNFQMTYSTETLDASPSVREAYKRVMNRYDRYRVSYIKYIEAMQKSEEKSRDKEKTETPALTNLIKRDQYKSKGNLSISDYSVESVRYWRDFNTSDDKLLSSLKYLAQSLHLPYSIKPTSILSGLLETAKFAPLKKLIQLRVNYLNIINYYRILKLYLEVSKDLPYIESKHVKWVVEKHDVITLLKNLNDSIIDYVELSSYNFDDSFDVEQFEDVTLDTLDMALLRKAIESIISHYNYDVMPKYTEWRSTKKIEAAGLDVSKFEETAIKDTRDSFVQFVTDELPWKIWYEMALVKIISIHKPALIECMASKTTPRKNKLAKGMSKLSKGIIKAAEKKDTKALSEFWSRVPANLRDNDIDVINKNLYEVTAIYTPAPIPITAEMIGTILQSDNEDDSRRRFKHYIDTRWADDLSGYVSSEGQSDSQMAQILADIGSPDILWEDTVEWVKVYLMDERGLTLPTYIKEYELPT